MLRRLLLGRREPKAPVRGWRRVALPMSVSVVMLSTGYWLLRRFRRRLRQSQLLRDTEGVSIDPPALETGSYVRLRGRVEPAKGTAPLVSPEKGVSCVMYRTIKARVIDQKMWERSISSGGNYQVAGGFWGKLTRILPFGRRRRGLGYDSSGVNASANLKKESWGMILQEISNNASSVAVYLRDERGAVRLEVAGAEFFELDTAVEEFQAAPQGTVERSRETLGFKTTERVLPVGKELLVFGEVHRREGAAGDGGAVISVGKPKARHMLDVKTTEITKPFVVTSKSDLELLDEVERSGRKFLLLAAPITITGSVIAATCLVAIWQDTQLPRP